MTTPVVCTISFSGSKTIDSLFEEAVRRLKEAQQQPEIQSPLAHVFFGASDLDSLPALKGLRLSDVSTYDFIVESPTEPDEFLKYLVEKLSSADPRCYVENSAYEDEYRKIFQLAWLGQAGPVVETRCTWLELPSEDEFDDPDDYEQARIAEHETSDRQIDEEREALFQLMKKSRRKP